MVATSVCSSTILSSCEWDCCCCCWYWRCYCWCYCRCCSCCSHCQLLSMLLQPLLQVLSRVSLFITIAVAIVIVYRCCPSSLPLFLFLLLFYHSATQVSNFFHTRVCQAAQSSLLSHLALKSQASNPGECSGCLTRLANSSGVGTNWAVLWGDRMRSTG